MPLNACLLAMLTCAAVHAAGRRQVRSTMSPSFDVVSIRRSASNDAGRRLTVAPGGRFIASNATLKQLMMRAYGVQAHFIAGGPKWFDTMGFDLEARADGNVSAPTLALMLQATLAERFHLVVHREVRPLPSYALVVVRRGTLGPRIRQVTRDCDAIAEQAVTSGVTPEVGSDGKLPCSVSFGGWGQMSVRSKPLAPQVIGILSQVTGRTVVDATGLTGSFDFDLEWTPDTTGDSPGVPLSIPDGPTSLYSALQEQLGLKLESRTVPGEALVIDSVTEPTPN